MEMHCLNSGSGAAGAHTSSFAVQPSRLAVVRHARANLFQGGGEALVFALGRHPLCSGVGGAMVIDWAQGTPPQSLPAGIAFSPLQRPPQPAGGFDEVWATPSPSPAQVAAAAVTVVGRTHEPLVGPHEQASQWIGPSA
jgi:hypothetical protein